MSVKFTYDEEKGTLIIKDDTKTNVFKIYKNKYGKLFKYIAKAIDTLDGDQSTSKVTNLWAGFVDPDSGEILTNLSDYTSSSDDVIILNPGNSVREGISITGENAFDSPAEFKVIATYIDGSTKELASDKYSFDPEESPFGDGSEGGDKADVTLNYKDQSIPFVVTYYDPNGR